MKNSLVLIGLILTLNCSAQIDLILNEHLTEQEYSYLNAHLNRDLYNFDFTNKKVAFFNSPGGTIIRSKSDFFITENDNLDSAGPFDIIVFKESQKTEHGYDVAIIYGSKNTKPNVSNRLKRMVRKFNQ